jgi:inhibitor of cysteine peptidase
MRATAVAFAALLVLVSLPACSPRSPAPIELTQTDSGSTQALSAEQELRITLDSNPTTGFLWDVDGEVPPQLEQIGEPKYTAQSSALGAGGTEVWTFKASSSGEGALRLKYWRSFEPTAEPAETFEVIVKVE